MQVPIPGLTPDAMDQLAWEVVWAEHETHAEAAGGVAKSPAWETAMPVSRLSEWHQAEEENRLCHIRRVLHAKGYPTVEPRQVLPWVNAYITGLTRTPGA